MKKKISFVLASALAALSVTPALACTGTYIGSAVSADGSTMVARTEDISAAHAKQHIVVPSKHYAAGEMFVDEGNGFTYPQPETAYKYTMVPDSEVEEDGIFGEIGFNEYGVSVDATVSAGANEKALAADPLVENGLREANMVSVLLPRIKTAKEGVELVAKILEEKGAAEGNILTIADSKEVWYIEIYTGHHFAAYKAPDNMAAVYPNCFMLGSVDLSDTENYYASPDLISFAKEKGFYKEHNGKFHAALSYSAPVSGGNRDRLWAGQNKLGHKVAYDAPVFELFFTPEGKVTLKDVMELQRYRNEGTEKTPEKNSEVRTIGTAATCEAHIVQLKKDYPAELGGLLWMTMGNPEHSVYLPSYGNIQSTPKEYQVKAPVYDAQSAYWKFRSLAALSGLNREKYGAGVRAYWNAYENKLIEAQKQTDTKVISMMKQNKEQAAQHTTKLAAEIAADAMSKADTMFNELMAYVAKEEGRPNKAPFKPSVMQEFEPAQTPAAK